MSRLHMRENLGTILRGSAAQFFLAQIDYQSKLRHSVNGEISSKNTTQNQPKTHANQLTSCKFCSSTAQLSLIHTHGPACIASFHSPPIFSGCMRSF